MDKRTLGKILREHKKWLESNKTKGSRASLAGEDLRGADLCKAELNVADLHAVDLSEARLCGAYLGGADLRGANLFKADLRGASLVNAKLDNANLENADLRDVCLCNVGLRWANLKGADLRGADIDFACWPLWCGSLKAKIDMRLASQLLYHTIRAMQSVDDARCKAVCNDPKVIRLANEFHRVEECGKIHKEGRACQPRKENDTRRTR